MDPYRASWQYGYTLGPGSQAHGGAYATYYKPQATAVNPGIAAAAAQQAATVATYQHHPKPREYRPQTVTHIQTSAEPPPSAPVYQTKPAARPYVPTKQFVKGGTVTPGKPQAVVTPGSTAVYEGAGSQGLYACMRVHEMAIHNQIVETYEKVEDEANQGLQTVRLKLGYEVFSGTGSTFKAAKQAAAATALNESKLPRPVEKKTLKPRPRGITATQEMHEMATRKGATATFRFIEPANFEFKASMRLWSKEEMRGSYYVQLNVNGVDFYGRADLPQQAKHNASLQALTMLGSLPDAKANTNVQATTTTVDNATGTATGTGKGKNIIMALNEIAMAQGVCIDWTMLNEVGPAHQRAFTWTLKMGDYESVGTGNSKKIAKANAAQIMYQTLPEEWKADKGQPSKSSKRKASKRKSTTNPSQPGQAKKPALALTSSGGSSGGVTLPTPAGPQMPAGVASVATSGAVTSTNTTMDHIEIPGERKIKAGGESVNTPSATPTVAKEKVFVYSIIQNTNPISAIYEYCKKVKYPDPVFECVSENVLEVWQKDRHTYKKVEYTMRLEVAGKNYFGLANTKKAAKTAVATEAWNIIRSGTV